MRVEAKIQKWGNGLALRISGVMRDIPGFQEGAAIDVDVNEDGLVIHKRKESSAAGLPYSEQQLLAGLDESTAQANLLADLIAPEIPE